MKYESEARLWSARALANRKRRRQERIEEQQRVDDHVDGAVLDMLADGVADGDAGAQAQLALADGHGDGPLALSGFARPKCGCARCDDERHPMYHSLNVAGGFQLKGSALQSGQLLKAVPPLFFSLSKFQRFDMNKFARRIIYFAHKPSRTQKRQPGNRH